MKLCWARAGIVLWVLAGLGAGACQSSPSTKGASTAAISPSSAAATHAPSSPPVERAPTVGVGSEDARTQPPSAVTPATASPAKELFRQPMVGQRLVAIGDVHGDYEATVQVLQLAGAIDESAHWVGKDLTVVQTGDLLDRGDGERKILELLGRLEGEAKVGGGALYVMNGNHETMNVAGDYRYVTPGGFQDFEGTDLRDLPERVLRQLPPQAKIRAQAFLPGRQAARELAHRPLVLVVGSSVFAHGGVLLSHLDYGLDKLNSEISAWFKGDGPVPPAATDPDAPVWTRLYSADPVAPEACEQLSQVLMRLGVERMVVGHTVQPKGITTACDGRVFRIDVGMSSYYGGNEVQALEITEAGTRVLSQAKR